MDEEPEDTVSDLASNPLAHHLAPTATNGLRRSAAGPAWPAHIFCKASNRGSLTLKPEAPLAAAQRCKAISDIRSAAVLLPLKAQRIRGACGAFPGKARSQQPAAAIQQPTARVKGRALGEADRREGDVDEGLVGLVLTAMSRAAEPGVLQKSLSAGVEVEGGLRQLQPLGLAEEAFSAGDADTAALLWPQTRNLGLSLADGTC